MEKVRAHKSWLAVEIECCDETKEAIANYLFEKGAQGLEESEHSVKAFFKPDVSRHDLQDDLQKYLQSLMRMGFVLTLPKTCIEDIEDKDWNAEWKKQFQPLRISKRMMIKPSWIGLDKEIEILINIDPGMAFGTGTHETTQLMLKLIEEYVGKHARILDLGTGTGILAIAAAKLGAQEILACDTDPLATIAARENFSRNRIKNVKLFTGGIEAVKPIFFDFILANINRSVIVQILPKMTRFLKSNGFILLSGILIDEELQIKTSLKKSDLHVVEMRSAGEWLSFAVQKKK